MHAAAGDESIGIGGSTAAESYLDADKILEAAYRTGAEAIHPGYGFLAENAEFAGRCEAAGIAFIGPTPDQIRAFGLKHTARALATKAGVPLLPGTELLTGIAQARRAAKQIGYPVMLKSTAGGGGIGMRRCADSRELAQAFDAVTRLAETHFKQAGSYLEKFVDPARHVEVQIFGDGRGRVLALGQRDCSLQRRNQKVIEETPPPGLAEETPRRAGRRGGAPGRGGGLPVGGHRRVHRRSARRGAFYFLEVNTRIQVEHGVTEEVTGVDIVEWMVRVAAGESLPRGGAARAGAPPSRRGSTPRIRSAASSPAPAC